MPLFSIPGLENMSEVEQCEELFEVLMQSSDDVPGSFARIQRAGRGLGGIIIVGWKEGSAKAQGFFADGTRWKEFDDETAMQDPKIYRSLKGLIAAVEKYRGPENQYLRYDKIGVAVWTHPDSDQVAMEKYVRMTGLIFPGSTRR